MGATTSTSAETELRRLKIEVRKLQSLVERLVDLQESKQEPEKFLSRKEVASICGIGLSTVRKYISEGKLQEISLMEGKHRARKVIATSELIRFQQSFLCS